MTHGMICALLRPDDGQAADEVAAGDDAIAPSRPWYNPNPRLSLREQFEGLQTYA
jgi:hypothetical protein